MKRIALFLIVVVLSLETKAFTYNDIHARQSPEWFREAVVYQISLRAFTPEGTLNAAAERLPYLKDLGVTVLYLLPPYVSDDDQNRANWSPRQLESGFTSGRNPYRLKDYFHIDPEYGTDEDMKAFVKQAHELGLRVFFDLVYGHCGPNSNLWQSHPDWFKYDKNGNPLLTKYNFPIPDMSNSAVRTYFKTNMVNLILEYGADGFRCDASNLVPLDFWEEARTFCQTVKPDIVMIGEEENPANTRFAFDATYSWNICYRTIMRSGLMQGQHPHAKGKGAAVIREWYGKYMDRVPKGSLYLHMTDNHDWSTDSFDERAEKVLGHANQELGLATIFAIEGVPFIYNGQEIADSHRHSLFGHEGCHIDWSKSDSEAAIKRKEVVKKLIEMRKSHRALTHGTLDFIDNDRPQEILSFRRTDPVSGENVVFVANFSPEKVSVTLVGGRKITLEGWGYTFLICCNSSYPEVVRIQGGEFHVQGIALDKEKGCMYASFTSAFFKTDMEGNVIGSVTGMNGHMGDVVFDPVRRKVYASLEMKGDEIGKNISENLHAGVWGEAGSRFCIAEISVDDITGPGTPFDQAIKLYDVGEALDDYLAEVKVGDKVLKHRYGCSGIDGITIAPAFGADSKSSRLYVAYGVYGDTLRCDNDHNVLLCYSLDRLEEPESKYFVYTGNTTYGIQNLAYDSFTDRMYLAVYPGKKSKFPNNRLFAIDMKQVPYPAVLEGVPYHSGEAMHVDVCAGYDFGWGSTGFCPLGDGRYYISHNSKQDGKQICAATMYRHSSADDGPFVR